MKNYCWMCGAAIGALLISWAPASAETAMDGDHASNIESVVVTGFRKSLDEARTFKRESAIIGDAIVAEEMAKFPELNLAEALQRLPGVAINREAGEGRRVTLRGLGPDFTRVQLNGMEVLGNVDSAMDSRGQRSRDRAFDFNIFASELFSKVEVEKSYSASQNEGGMAGTIGLFTARPFDYAPGIKGALSVKAGSNSYTQDLQPRVAGMFGYNWNNKLGILVSVAWSKRKTQEQGYNVYSPNIESADKMANTYVANGLDISHLSAADQAKMLSGSLVWQSGNRLSVWDAKQARLGITASMQWRPVEDFTMTLDVLKGRFSTNRDEYHLATRAHGDEIIFNEAYADGSPGTNQMAFHGSTINAIKYDSTGFVYYADVSNAAFGSEHRREKNINNFDQAVLSFDWAPASRLHVDGHVGAETSTYHMPLDDKLYLEAEGGITATYDPSGRTAHNTYDWDTTNPANYHIREMYFRQSNQYSTFRDGLVNGTYDFNDSLTFKAGFTYRRYKSAGTEAYNDGLYMDEFKSKPGYDSVYPYSRVFGENNAASWVTGNWDEALKFYNKYHTMIAANGTPTTDIETTFAVVEETKAEYAQIDWKTEVFGKTLRGNAGVRAYQTDLTSSGLVSSAAGFNISTGHSTDASNASVKSSYDGFLPAFNAVLELTDSVQIRAAAAKNINRPTLYSMAVGGSVSYDSGQWSVNNGNPYLKPFTSNDYDLAAEWYFGKVGMIAGGIFHKDISNLISGVTEHVAYSATGLPISLGKTTNPNAPALTTSTIVQYSHPINQATAGISGLELAAQSDFFFLPEPFNHFGVVSNATFITSNTVVNGLNGPITGLSNTNANATLYYETDLWGARMSANYRSGYLDQRYDGSDPTSKDGMDSTTYVDAAAFYNVYDNLRLTLDAINLTNQREVQYNSIYHRLHNETTSGTTVFVGFNLQY